MMNQRETTDQFHGPLSSDHTLWCDPGELGTDELPQLVSMRSEVAHPRYRTVSRPPDELQLHPSLVRHGIPEFGGRIDSVSLTDSLPMRDLVLITRNNIVLAGYEIWRAALLRQDQTVACLEYNFTDEEALRWILAHSLPSQHLNNFQRILLALDLEPSLIARAKENQQTGGRLKGSSELSEAQTIDTCHEIAKAAGVGAGSVRKVKKILQDGHPQAIEALHSREIHIDRAFEWLKDTEAREDYFAGRVAREIRRDVVRIVRKHSAIPVKRLLTPSLQRIGYKLAEMRGEELSCIYVLEIPISGQVICFSSEFLNLLKTQADLPYEHLR